jgi:hypothetical protein
MAFIRRLLVLSMGFLVGCATTNFAKSPSPVTVKEQWTREGLTVWGGPRVFRIGNVEMGYSHESGSTFTVDPGSTVMRVWYYANRAGFSGVFTQTDLVEIPITLEPRGHYELRAVAKESTVVFSVIDLAKNQEIAATPEVPIVLGASRLPNNTPIVIPIYIPAH